MTAPTAPPYLVIRGALESAAQPIRSVGDGMRSCRLVGREEGARHLGMQISELDPGAQLVPHLHAHEETVMLLQGEVELWLAGTWHRLDSGCFAAIPLGAIHAWRNPGVELARWFTVRAPLPPVSGEPGMVQIDMPDHVLGDEVRDVGSIVPWESAVGRLTDEDRPPFGPLSMGGLGHYGTHVKSISVTMAVDHYRGAIHHTMFLIAAPPRTSDSPSSLAAHVHPFEEGFLIMQDETEWEIEGDQVRASVGDMVWVGVGTSHKVMSAPGSSARWIEVQAPAPPRQHGFLFPAEWRDLARARQSGDRSAVAGPL